MGPERPKAPEPRPWVGARSGTGFPPKPGTKVGFREVQPSLGPFGVDFIAVAKGPIWGPQKIITPATDPNSLFLSSAQKMRRYEALNPVAIHAQLSVEVPA